MYYGLSARSSQQDNSDHFTNLFDIACGAHAFNERERMMVTSVIYYLRSRSGSNRASPTPQFVVGRHVSQLDMIGSTLSVPLLLSY